MRSPPPRGRPRADRSARRVRYRSAVLRTICLIATTLLATACNAFSPGVEASVRGNNETGRYVASITNNTETDLYATCYVDALVEYGSVGSDRFLVRGVAGATTDHLGSVSLDDGGAEYEIECVKDFSVELNTTVG